MSAELLRLLLPQNQWQNPERTKKQKKNVGFFYWLRLTGGVAGLHLHRCGPAWLSPCVLFYRKKDHYQLCLAEINWITTTRMWSMCPLGQLTPCASVAKTTVINAGYCCRVTAVHAIIGLRVSPVRWSSFTYSSSASLQLSAFPSPSRPDAGCYFHPSHLPSYFILISSLSAHLHPLYLGSTFSAAVFPSTHPSSSSS